MTRVDLVVVGGGITGLAAAWEARQQGAEVLLLEADHQPGGKLRTSTFAGVPLDESADAFLARVPEAVELCRELGIDTELVAPATGRAYVWVDGHLRPLPEAQLLGVPTDLDAVAETGILSAGGIARARRDLDTTPDTDAPPTHDPARTRDDPLPPDDDRGSADEAVGALVRRRLGDEVYDRLVAPLVGGIWAGDCDRLSLQAATPALAEAWGRSPSLIRGAAEIRAGAVAAGPVFLAPRGGMGRLVDALVEALGDRIRTGDRVAAVSRIDRVAGSTGGGRWQVHLASSVEATADAVVVATPAFAAAPLVDPHSPAAAAALAGIDYASVALVALAVSPDGIEHPLDGSGFLVPPSSGRLLTACSWTSSKWPHLTGEDGSTILLRASAGRDGDDRALALDDPKLISTLLADLADTMGLRGQPEDIRITRWWRSFPQPRPGHLDRVTALEADLAAAAPGLRVAGAWARGVGIPACIRAGRQAARSALGLANPRQ
jgi:protoporphyrinogen/coproporphyrinogen III oxidase